MMTFLIFAAGFVVGWIGCGIHIQMVVRRIRRRAVEQAWEALSASLAAMPVPEKEPAPTTVSAARRVH